jgi:carboxyl-terminal processing protease
MTQKSNTNNNWDVKIAKAMGIVILVVVVFALGIMSGRLWEEKGDSSNSPSQLVNFTGDTQAKEQDLENVDFDLFWEIWDTMADDYVEAERVDEKEMYYGAIKGVVESYGDPATLFLTPEETEAFDKSTAGNYFSGIGAELGYENDRIIVISPIEGSPADKAGIRAGDIILEVDGEEIKPKDNIYDVVLDIRGEEGSDVRLTVLHRDATEPVEITITRGDITVPSMEIEEVEDNKDIYVIDISRFTEASLEGWKKKWDKSVGMVKEGRADALIIDLRGNPGGYFDAAVYAAEDFLEKGTVVAQQENRAGDKKIYEVSRDGKLLDIPVVVLVNEGSASASEILSGALQQNDRAMIVGEDTYGKGTAQSIVPFEDGSSLHLTVMKWLLPNGEWINRENPINPDKVVEYGDEEFYEGTDPQMEAAIKELEKRI